MIMPSTLASRLAMAIAADVPVECGDGQPAIDADAVRLDALLGGNAGASGWRIWTNSRCLVTTRRFAAMPRFTDAALESACRGWPVFVRPSGGTTVAHRPGMLNASHFQSWRGDGDDAIRRFRIFCEPFAASICSVGISVCLGHVDRSHCDGRFNLVSGGRKLAGTASLVRCKGGYVGLLCHASIWVEGDIAADVRAVERFEAALELDTSYSENVHATLEQHFMASFADADIIS